MKKPHYNTKYFIEYKGRAWTVKEICDYTGWGDNYIHKLRKKGVPVGELFKKKPEGYKPTPPMHHYTMSDGTVIKTSDIIKKVGLSSSAAAFRMRKVISGDKPESYLLKPRVTFNGRGNGRSKEDIEADERAEVLLKEFEAPGHGFHRRQNG